MCMISKLVPCTKKLGMQSELHRHIVHQSVELPLLVPMLFLLVVPKCILMFKENFIALLCILFVYPKNHSYIRLILELTNTPFLNLSRRWCRIKSIVHYVTLDELPRYTEATNATKWQHWGMLIQGETNFVLAQRCTYCIATGAKIFTLHVRT